MVRAIFLDRDGVIVENRPDYIKSWAEVKFIPGVIDAMTKLALSDYQIFIITNQSVIGRGIISLQTAKHINYKIIEIIQQKGGRIEEIFICPHTPEDNCPCRKPKPGLIFKAKEKYNIDLKNSILIGDSITDLQAGFSAGVGKNILVRTGRGSVEEHKPEAIHMEPFLIFDSLPDTVNALPGLKQEAMRSSDQTAAPKK